MNKVQAKYKYAVIATDVALFTVEKNNLKVLLIKMKKDPFTGMWALPGGLIDSHESIDDAAKRVLEKKTGVNNVYLEQLATFGKVDRDPFGRVVSVAYFSLIPSERLMLHTTSEYEDVAWFSVGDISDLAYDHKAILQAALEQLKHRLEYSNIALSLLPREFTLTDLQRLYETILGKTIDKRNFRKNVLRSGLLKSTGKRREGQAHRPAELYRFTSKSSHIVRVL